jgi:predicted ATPase/two-component SAPR family response regulator
VLRALDPSAEAGAGALPALLELLRTNPPLLILDNCEHVVEACAELADALLRGCPDLCILATSREALGVPGERAWLVPPLCLPEGTGDALSDADCDAVRLFVDRARDVTPGFEITAQNAAAVVDICTRLDGIPLAIELAAARVRLMTPDQIRDRLSDAFSLLTSGSRTVLPRHRTLRAAIDWSHDLLREEGRAVLRRLSVFRAGFTLDAAEAVAAGDGIASGDVLDLVSLLLDRSLLVMREHNGSARYHLLETMRQYARQRLREAGEELETERAMAQHFVALVTGIEPSFTTTQRRAAFAQVDPELDNIREVLRWTQSHDTEAHVRLVGAMWWYWFSSRHWMEARRLIDGALELPEGSAPTRARAALLFAGGALASLQAQVEPARAQLREAIDLASSASDSRLQAYALNYLGMTYAQVGGAEALEYSGRAEQWFRAHGDEYGLRLALLLMGMSEAGAGRADRARDLMTEAVVIARRFGQDRELGVALQTLAFVLIGAGDETGAEALLIEALGALRRDWSYLFVGRVMDMLALTAVRRDPAVAARRIGAGDALRGHVGAARFHVDQARIDAAVPELRRMLGDAAWQAAYDEGHAHPAEVIEETLAAAEPPATAAHGAAAESPAAAGASDPDSDPVAVRAASVRDGAAIASVPEHPDLRARLLGGFDVWVEGARVEAWSYAKPKELLAYLLAHPRGRTRAEIGAAIWPDATAAQLRNSFHVTMHHLRKALGRADWVVIENERYRIAAGVSVDCDADRFERGVRSALAGTGGAGPGGDAAVRTAQVAGLRTALALYADHYLHGEIAGPWRDEEQDRLRGLFTTASLRLGELLAGAGDAEGAAAIHERLIVHEPLLEEAHCRLMLHWSAMGERVRAIRHYERLAARLRAELELEPDEATTELYEALRKGDFSGPLTPEQ